jgi:hypothetical protein
MVAGTITRREQSHRQYCLLVRTCLGVYEPAGHVTQEPVLVLPLPVTLYSEFGGQVVPAGGLQLSALASAAIARRQATANKSLLRLLMVGLQEHVQQHRSLVID